ncbi:MAG TPA: PilZ domain-containing protein [Methylophilaceae bacterium]
MQTVINHYLPYFKSKGGISIMRRFIRHPVNVPIEVSAGQASLIDCAHTSDIGLGGLAFHCDKKLQPGTMVHIKIPYIYPTFESDAKVIWCRELRHGTDLAVEFLSEDDAFKARMIEQICYIENYRHAAKSDENRMLTFEEAAMEWIDKYAADFPSWL